MKLQQLLDWEEIAHKLRGLYKREATHGGGPEPYSPLAMFKLTGSRRESGVKF